MRCWFGVGAAVAGIAGTAGSRRWLAHRPAEMRQTDVRRIGAGAADVSGARSALMEGFENRFPVGSIAVVSVAGGGARSRLECLRLSLWLLLLLVLSMHTQRGHHLPIDGLRLAWPSRQQAMRFFRLRTGAAEWLVGCGLLLCGGR